LALLIVILGLLLSAAGAFFIILGFDIVMTDRGAAMTTSGTTAFTGGVMTLAIGFMLWRLTQILEALKRKEAGGSPEASGRPEAGGPVENIRQGDEPRADATRGGMASAGDPAEASAAPMQRAAMASAAVGAGALASQAALRGVEPTRLPPPAFPEPPMASIVRPDPALRQPPEQALKPSAPQPDEDAGESGEPPSDAMKELDRILGFAPEEPPVIADLDLADIDLDDNDLADRHDPVDDVAADAPTGAAPAQDGGGSPSDVLDEGREAAGAEEGGRGEEAPDGDLEFLLKGAEADEPITRPDAEDEAFGHAPDVHEEDAPDGDAHGGEDDAASAAPADRPERSDPAPSEAATSGREAEAVRPMVLGSYRAGGRVYTMFADGSVEAVTEHGVERFASMEALRAHLART
jgi:hypothetical protein